MLIYYVVTVVNRGEMDLNFRYLKIFEIKTNNEYRLFSIFVSDLAHS